MHLLSRRAALAGAAVVALVVVVSFVWSGLDSVPVHRRKRSYAATFVTSLYVVGVAKRPFSAYLPWLENLVLLSQPLVMFVDSDDTRAKIAPILGRRRAPTEVRVLAWEEFFVYKFLDKWKEHHALDREKSYHSPQLYMLWAEKSAFLSSVAQRDPFETSFFYWIDVGYVRSRAKGERYAAASWPNVETLRRFPRILLLQVGKFSPAQCSAAKKSASGVFEATISVGGGFFGGHKKFIEPWREAFYAMLTRFFDAGLFAGKDQSLMAHVAIQSPSLVHLVEPQPKGDEDLWFYLTDFIGTAGATPGAVTTCNS